MPCSLVLILSYRAPNTSSASPTRAVDHSSLATIECRFLLTPYAHACPALKPILLYTSTCSSETNVYCTQESSAAVTTRTKERTMPPQHVEIAETVAALRRKLRRDKEGERDNYMNSLHGTLLRPGLTANPATSNPSAPTSQTTQFASNRGNKLKPGVRYVHAGSLPHRSGLTGYREVNDSDSRVLGE